MNILRRCGVVYTHLCIGIHANPAWTFSKWKHQASNGAITPVICQSVKSLNFYGDREVIIREASLWDILGWLLTILNRLLLYPPSEVHGWKYFYKRNPNGIFISIEKDFHLTPEIKLKLWTTSYVLQRVSMEREVYVRLLRIPTLRDPEIKSNHAAGVERKKHRV